MIRRIITIIAAVTAIFLAAYYHRTELELRYSRAHFPAGWAPPSPGWPADAPHFVSGWRNAVLVGEVRLESGEALSYWFLSHHQTGDFGGTLFQYPDGSTRFIEGYFCCEVEFSDPGALKDLSSFTRAIDQMDGRSP